MNNESFLIEECDLELARDICKFIDNPAKRNRAAANITAAKIASKYFTDFEVDTSSGLHNIWQVLNDIEISDIYIKGTYIDVRVYFNENELCVPKSHFDRNILPIAYMFVKLETNLSGALVTGFVLPSSIDTGKEYDGYYKVNEDDLISFYDIESRFATEFIDDLPDNFDTMIFDYLDGNLEDADLFYKLLLTSKEAREKLYNASRAQTIFNFVSITAPEASPETVTEANQETLELIEDTPLGDLDTETPVELDIDSELEIQGEIEDFSEPVDSEELTLIDSSEDLGLIEEEHSEDLTDEAETPTDEVLSVNEENDLNTDIEQVITEDEAQDYPLSYDDTETEIPAETLDILEENTTAEEEPILADEIDENIQTEDEQEPAFEYSTSVTPSIDSLEEQDDNSVNIGDLEEILDSEAEENTDNNSEENAPQIDTLFNNEEDSSENIAEQVVTPKTKSSKLIPLLSTLVVIAGIGYYGYTKFMPQQLPANEPQELGQTAIQGKNESDSVQQDAMPIETVENIEPTLPTNEGTSVSIPAIEQNLDASILVSNLTVNWEVPAGYVTNNTAKRYFTKMGKVIQLNLKTELLLLSKPPITNKIAIELEFNNNTQKFDIKGITASSGEKTVDDLIIQTVKKALSINLNMNMSAFSGIPGNPVLVIKL